MVIRAALPLEAAHSASRSRF